MKYATGLFLALLLCLPSPGWGQQATGQIVGTITGDGGQPLAGVVVAVEGTQLSGLTNASGAYVIAGVPPGTYSVRAMVIGYSTATVENVSVAAGQSVTVNFALQSQAIALEGLVAVGYGTQQRRDITGSISSIRAERFQQVPVANAIEAIKGLAPGVDIRTSGYRPGDGITIRVRGTRSINAGNDPLYVLDGVPMSGGINDISPNDIASIEILKDASATAIYGSRGANGVVLITTKQGQAGGTQITYDTYFGVQDVHRLVRVMNGPEFAQLKREAYRTVNKYHCAPTEKQCDEGDRDLFIPQEYEGLQQGISTNWQELIKQQGLQQNHQIRVSGGNEATRFSVSGNWFDQDGVTKGMSFVRRTAAFNIDHTRGRLRVGMSSNVTDSDQVLGYGNSLWGEALALNPLGYPWFEDGTPNPLPVPDGQRWNPLLDLEHYKSESSRTRFFASAYAALTLAEGVTFRATFGPDLTFTKSGTFQGSLSRNRRFGDPAASMNRGQTVAYTLTNQLTINRRFFDTHSIQADLLYEIQKNRSESHNSSVSGLPYEHQLWWNLGSASLIQGVGSNISEWALQSYMARVNYSFRDRYLLTLTGRVDGSSRLAEGNKYSFFPSIAVSWRIIEEPFMQNTPFSDLKVRVSYGITGNTSISPYQTQGGLSRTTYSFGGAAAFGYRPSSLANPSLDWEKTRPLDVGLDFGLFNHRISGTIDFYVSHTYDLLLSRQLPATSGFSSVLENVGETKNTGLEIAISTVNVENWNGLRWTTDISWSTNKNEIVSLYGGKQDDIGNAWFIGKPINVYYDYKFAGIWQLDEAEEAAKYAQVPGQIKLVDQNGDGRITGEDRVIIGRHQNFPLWYGGLSTRLEWKRFDLTASAVARWGYTVNSGFHTGNNSLFGRYNNLLVDYWLPDNPSNTDPRPNADQEAPLYGGTRAYKDGSHWRIRNITLGYTAPTGFANRWGVQSLRVYATAQDPFVFTSYDGFDPESGTGAASPSYWTLLLGASVSF